MRNKQATHPMGYPLSRRMGWVLLSLCVAALLGTSIITLASAAPGGVRKHHPDSSVYFPKGSQHVVCDRRANFCADEQGISMGLTALYLGQAAQQRLQTVVKDLSVDELSRYTLTSGVHCDSKKRTCFVSKYSTQPDAAMTRQLYGP